MSRSLRVISINFRMTSPAVVNEDSLVTSRALFDFDVVVIRPYALPRPSGRYDNTGNDRAAAEAEMTRKRPDLVRVLKQGGLVVVIMDRRDIIQFDPNQFSYTFGSKVYTTSNYDFVTDELYKSISNGDGTRYTVTKPAEPFSEVLRNSEVAWSAYFHARPAHPFTFDSIFATNGSDAFIGSIATFGSGYLVFLPNFKSLDEQTFLKVCAEYRFAREGTPPPKWAPEIYLPGLEEATEAVRQAEEAVASAQRKRDELAAAAGELEAHKKLLYEKGKFQLEPAVRKAFDLLGFRTTESEVIKGTEFEIDGRTTVGSVGGILEVKGSKNQIVLAEFSKFVVKPLADFEATKKMPKGIFVGNGLCEQSPTTRLGETVFSPHVLDAANTHSIALINSVELYWLVCHILAGEPTKVDKIRELILNGSGYVSLQPYYTKTSGNATAAE